MAKKQTQRLGPGGFCVCVKCEHRVAHERGTPCLRVRCPACGGRMVREGSAHDEARKRRGAVTAKSWSTTGRPGLATSMTRFAADWKRAHGYFPLPAPAFAAVREEAVIRAPRPEARPSARGRKA